jgi:hypothetical protein
MPMLAAGKRESGGRYVASAFLALHMLHTLESASQMGEKAGPIAPQRSILSIGIAAGR